MKRWYSVEMARRSNTLTVLHNRGDFDRGAQFPWRHFFESAWDAVWPDGLQVVDTDGVEYVVFSYETPRGMRQGLRNCSCVVRPRNERGGTFRE